MEQSAALLKASLYFQAPHLTMKTVVLRESPAKHQLSQFTQSWALVGLLLGSVLNWRQTNKPPSHFPCPVLEKLRKNKKIPALIYNNLQRKHCYRQGQCRIGTYPEYLVTFVLYRLYSLNTLYWAAFE